MDRILQQQALFKMSVSQKYLVSWTISEQLPYLNSFTQPKVVLAGARFAHVRPKPNHG